MLLTVTKLGVACHTVTVTLNNLDHLNRLMCYHILNLTCWFGSGFKQQHKVFCINTSIYFLRCSMFVKRDEGSHLSCAHGEPSSTRFWIRLLPVHSWLGSIPPGIPGLWLVVQCQVWKQCGVLWPKPWPDDSGDNKSLASWTNWCIFIFPGSEKSIFIFIVIIIITRFGYLQLDRGWA